MMGVLLPITWVVNSVSVTEPGPAILPHLITHIQGNLTLKQLDGRILIGGAWRGDGDPYSGRKQVNLKNFKGNVAWACQAVPAIRQFRILRSWVGFQGQSPDRLFVMGELPPYNNRLYAMVGGSAGFSLAPIFGEMMAKWIITGSAPEDSEVFDVRRYCIQ
jgi:glycine/D-amino acid oxidase-like deaminating enzyme